MTAARAAGMPVRRPRRPAAVSAADAETDLELSCGALENDRQQTVPKAKSAEIEKFERKKTGARTGVRHVS